MNVNGVADKVPTWVLLLLTGISAPTAVGTAVWNDTQQNEISTLRANQITLVSEVAELRQQMLNKVSREDRLEMMQSLNERLERMDRHMEMIDRTLEERWQRAMDILQGAQTPGPP